MKAVKSRAEAFLMPIQSLSHGGKRALIARLLEGPQFREDIFDLAVIKRRQGEPVRPFREYLTDERE